MPIPFSLIPAHIQLNLAQKLDCRDFGSLKQSSKEAYEIANRVKSSLPVPREFNNKLWFDIVEGEARITPGRWIDECYKPIQIKAKLSECSEFRFKTVSVTIASDLDDNFCQILIDYFHKSGSTVYEFRCYHDVKVSCSVDSFNQLLEITQTEAVQCEYEIPVRYLKNLPRKIERINTTSPVQDADDLANIRASRIYLFTVQLGSSVLNALIKEWIRGYREIVKVSIESFGLAPLFVKEEIFEGIEYSETDHPEKFEVVKGSQKLLITAGDDYFNAEIVQ